jgi:hypothetical protein
MKNINQFLKLQINIIIYAIRKSEKIKGDDDM